MSETQNLQKYIQHLTRKLASVTESYENLKQEYIRLQGYCETLERKLNELQTRAVFLRDSETEK